MQLAAVTAYLTQTSPPFRSFGFCLLPPISSQSSWLLNFPGFFLVASLSAFSSCCWPPRLHAFQDRCHAASPRRARLLPRRSLRSLPLLPHRGICAASQAPIRINSLLLLFATGGALGSFFIGIAFPLIFSFNYDLALTFFITALLALGVTWSSGWPLRLLWTTASVLCLPLW